MIRHASAVVLALCLNPAWLYAQGMQLTVNTASAEIRKGPSITNPVIGHARRGTVLDVTRDVGDWLKISWPDAQDGVGYVRKNAASAARNSTASSSLPAANTSTRAAPIAPARSGPESLSPSTSIVTDQVGPERQLTPRRTAYISAPTHIIGLGGRMGGPMGASSIGFGATARAWSYNRLGLQLEVSRLSLTSVSGPGRVTSTQFAPSMLFSLPEHLTDYIWMRPYLGAGGHLNRSTLTGVTPGVMMSDNVFGFQTFGGGELTMASLPRFALSADAGYQWSRTSFAGFEPGGLGFSVAGHWYIK